MLKLLGSLLILSGGGMAWVLQCRERRRRRQVLRDLLTALERMGEEIRMTRRPLPGLLERLAKDCGPEAASLLRAAASAAAQGGDPSEAWRQGLGDLPLDEGARGALEDLELRGDEETIRKGISLASHCLAEDYASLEHRRAEEDKRAAALCFSGAALLVILLV